MSIENSNDREKELLDSQNDDKNSSVFGQSILNRILNLSALTGEIANDARKHMDYFGEIAKIVEQKNEIIEQKNEIEKGIEVYKNKITALESFLGTLLHDIKHPIWRLIRIIEKNKNKEALDEISSIQVMIEIYSSAFQRAKNEDGINIEYLIHEQKVCNINFWIQESLHYFERNNRNYNCEFVTNFGKKCLVNLNGSIFVPAVVELYKKLLSLSNSEVSYKLFIRTYCIDNCVFLELENKNLQATENELCEIKDSLNIINKTINLSCFDVKDVIFIDDSKIVLTIKQISTTR